MYQSFFNLSNKPFRLSPDPRFFFPSRGHKRALAYLRYGLSQDEGFVVITGGPGTGKTTLAKILLQEMDDRNVVVAHLTTTQLDADDMLRMVAASFGLRYEGLDKTGLLKALEHFLLARARERKRALLVIDEAQNLPARSLEELRMLSNLQVGDKALVQTFLLGQAQFRQMLDDPDLEQLRQRVIANYHLSPLAADECQRYIETRLEMVGWNNDPHFAEVAYEMIQEYSAGIPRRINMLCDRVLLYCCMEETHEVTGEVIQFVTNELDQEVSGKPLDLAEEDLAKSQEVVVESFKSRFGTDKKNRRSPKSASIREKHSTGGDDTKADGKQKKRAKASAGKQKPAANQDSAAKDNKANQKPDKNNGGEQVVGNTIKQRPSRKPDLNSGDHQPGHAEISERDLFRVIPGGKPSEQHGSPAIPKRQNLPVVQAQPSAEDVVQRRILRLVLAYHRSPSRFPGLDNASQPLPEGISELLELAVADDQVLNRVSPAAVMGISPVMLRAAVRFFIRRALFVVDGDDYRVLGLQPGAPQSLVEKHYDLLMRLLRQDKQRGSADSVTRVGQAYEALSRIDQAKQVPPPVTSPAGVSLPVHQSSAAPLAETSGISSIKLNDKDSDELTIDFDVINKQEITPPRSPFVGKPNEIFAPQTNFARKRVRYAGQLAVLGFGALVIMLGLYIVQMEPSDSPVKPDKTVAKSGQQDRSVDFEKPRQRGLQFSDGFANPANQAEFANLDTQSNTSKPESGDRAVFANSDSIEQVAMGDQDKQLVAQLEEIARLETKKRKQQKAARSTRVKPSAKPPRKAKPQQKLVKNRDRKAPSAPARKTVVSSSRKSSQTAGNLNQLNITSKPIQARTTRQNKVVITRKVETKTTLPVPPKSYKGKEIALASKAQVSKDQSTPAIQPKETTTATAQPTIQPKSASNSRMTTLATNKNLVEKKHRIITTNPTIKSSVIPSRPKVNNRDLNSLLSQFSSAYKAGSINEIMSVFAPNARTDDQTSASGIRKDYIDLFNTTRVRNMTFNDIDWVRETNHARGVGNYTATITPKSGGDPQIYSGEVTLQVQNRAGKLKITRFYYTNQSRKPAKRVASVKSATRSKPLLPTAVELQALVARFLKSYNNGDLKGFMGLFAEHAKTNDQPNKAGIRKDHLDLFNSTQVRQMVINNFIWAREENRSNGSGDFQVMIQANNASKFTTVKGKVRIIAHKTTRGVFITHLLHTIR